jgi:hypothetical protein
MEAVVKLEKGADVPTIKQAIFANRFIRIGEEDAQRVAEWASDKDGKNLPV